MKFRPFIAIALGLIALLHLYIGMRILPDLPVGPFLRTLGAAWLAISCLLIPAGLLYRKIERQPHADLIAWAGFLAMGLFSSLLVLTLLRDIAFIAASLLASFNALTPSMAFVSDSAAAVPLLALVITLIGVFNARRRARIVHVDVPLSGLPQELHGFTIVQISDLHVGPTIKRRYMQAIVDAVNALAADVVAVTGDVVDGSVPELAEHTAPLGQLRGRYGVYAVTGNHEYYSGAEEWIGEFNRIGLRVLMNEHVLLEHNGAKLALAGVPDYSAHQHAPDHRSDPSTAISGTPEDVAVKVLLAHQPRTVASADAAGFDLQLSGHTHGGQFLPWNLFVPMQQPYTAGLHRHGRAWIYISRGTGYWGPPIRFGAPSEITRIRLVVHTPR
jgi:predicted MPP superfamily phosphohydrolase